MSADKDAQDTHNPEAFEDARLDLPLQLHWELDAAGLSVWAIRVYLHMVRRAGVNGRIETKYPTMAEVCFRATFPTASTATLRRRAIEGVRELEERGFIQVIRTKLANNNNAPNKYRVLPRSAWKPVPDGIQTPTTGGVSRETQSN